MDTDCTAYVADRRPALLRAAVAIAGDPHTAEDLLQAALAKVCSRWELIREPRALDGYVRRTMRNQYASWCRESWRRHERPSDRLPELLADLGREPGGEAPPPGREHALWPLVSALPPRQRSAVVLRYYEGLTEAETSQVLRCSLGTVKSNTSRGLATLRRLAVHDPERFIA